MVDKFAVCALIISIFLRYKSRLHKRMRLLILDIQFLILDKSENDI
jgi:hypothetical protein